MWIIKVTPRFGDTDALGHITNTVPAGWFEQARNPLFHIFRPDLEIKPETFPLIMAHTDYDFVGEMFFKYDVEIRTGISRIGNKSFTVYHEAFQQDRLCAKGHAVIVYYDFNTHESVPIPEDFKRKLLEHFVREDAPLTTA
jgi:acyl-CoA thioester hydrolase